MLLHQYGKSNQDVYMLANLRLDSKFPMPKGILIPMNHDNFNGVGLLVIFEKCRGQIEKSFFIKRKGSRHTASTSTFHGMRLLGSGAELTAINN